MRAGPCPKTQSLGGKKGTPRIGHGGARIAFLDPASTGNVLVELAELPAGHGGH